MLVCIIGASELGRHSQCALRDGWRAACPYTGSIHPFRHTIDPVIAATRSRIPLRHQLALGACVLWLASACTGDTGGDAPRHAAATPAKNVTTADAMGDVVIAPPTVAYTTLAVATPGTVTGSVALKAALAPLAPIETGNEAANCGPSVPDESAQMQGGGLAGVVVWLDGLRSGKALGLERRIELESDHCKLRPRVQVAAVGSAVNIIGHDDFRQHLRFTVGGETAARATILLGGGEQVIPTDLPFTVPGMVAVRDAGHAWTRAYLAVFDHPYFAVTGAGGAFTIDGVPPGKYTLRAWHERTAVATQAVEVGANGVVKVAVVLEGK